MLACVRRTHTTAYQKKTPVSLLSLLAHAGLVVLARRGIDLAASTLARIAAEDALGALRNRVATKEALNVRGAAYGRLGGRRSTSIESDKLWAGGNGQAVQVSK